MIFAKEHKSIKMLVELRFLFSACPLMMLNICTKFHENIHDGNKFIGHIRFSLEIFQRGIISQNCRWSYTACSLQTD